MRANLLTPRREITRLEGFSDAVFGFALTLLVVSLEVPRTYAELMDAMRGFGAFAVCFAVVAWIWYEHNLFFRRYGLQDGYTILLNLVLLFVVLFYVYPLKFVSTMLLGGVFGGPRPTGPATAVSGPSLMLIYSLAVFVLFLIFALLYWHALRHRAELELDHLEVFDAQTGVSRHLLTAAVALVSILIVLLVPRQASLAGLIYFVLGPLHATYGFIRGKTRDRLPAAT
ncbi:MAG: TMEM175 family protein [Verrucomicrobiota bacterium]|nr:TMEM175 family protein [Verrucomicrobiota bacterium]